MKGGKRPVSMPVEPEWYKDAIIYEVHVRAFADSNADGIGDFPGLTSRLGYLQDLGVTAVWLLPFYPSPLRDDGYDIADYHGVHPSYGTKRDFEKFVSAAHDRGIRVITELVVNHTSDQHAWFKKAQKAPKGSPARDFYVWSETPDKYPGVRIIFQDTETSNWTYDPVAGEYYWHRFFSHQPDLNYENPAVQEAVKEVMHHWFELGVDGMRLDAVPYLFEREGTNCENLPETHDALRDLRSSLDERFPGRMLLAEANQWPEDAIAYFGDGDECHMNFHFPLMPRLFMGVRMEDSFPIIDILEQTPPIPENCQWAVFLRNHDELTLEMVTDEERDYMYRQYASDRQMRINLGIRRRLAPLLENDRRRVELMNGLLFSMPGTPVVYYGDEIGMGDNVYLGDRDAVRTPMQWSGDRNAGFSRANPQKLFLPVVIDPEYHFESINVESLNANTSSMLWWMKRLIALRKRHPVFGRGDLEFLSVDNPKVLAFMRRHEGEHVLVVANLSRFAQPVELDLSRYSGQRPLEMFGATPFPAIGELPYFLTMGPHAFHWFLLRDPDADSEQREGTPRIEAGGAPDRWLGSKAGLRAMERALARSLPTRRWFAGKNRSVRQLSIEDHGVLDRSPELELMFLLVRVSYSEGDDDLYAVPVASADPAHSILVFGEQSPAEIARVSFAGEGERVVYDAAVDPQLWKYAARLLLKKKSVKLSKGELVGHRERPAPKGASAAVDEVRLPRAVASNSNAVFGDTMILKLYRRVEPGPNPDLELSEHLTRRAGFEAAPGVIGSISYQQGNTEPITLAMAQRFVSNQGDAWSHSLDALGRYLDAALALPVEERGRGFKNAGDFIGSFLDDADLLGRRTAEMHLALADAHDDPAFTPETFSKLYQRSLYQSMRTNAQRAFRALKKAQNLPEPTRQKAARVVELKDTVLGRLRRVADFPLDSVRVRCHGDYHLGQVLWTGRDFVIIDFEGEPLRPIGERRLRRSVLSDVAGMLRSIQYAEAAGVRNLIERGAAPPSGEALDSARNWAAEWRRLVSARFLQSYRAVARPPVVPGDDKAFDTLLGAWLLHKAAYELMYELGSRPDWVDIPLDGMLQLLDDTGPR